MSSSPAAGVDPARVIANLRRLDSATGGPEGARRIAWSEEWERARRLVRSLADPALDVERDRFGNDWYLLPGVGEDLVVLGSHVDSVPEGGWLDGVLGVLAGLEVLAGLAAEGPQPRSLAVVDWADEEGARFGRSLLGSSAFCGTLDAGTLDALVDAGGERAADLLPRFGFDRDALTAPDPRLETIAAYLELHIEQGPVLDRAGLPIVAVASTVGIERDRLVFAGQVDHAGPSPMDGRRDAFLAAARTALAAEEVALAAGGRATTGRVDLDPGVPTAVAGEALLYVDLRHEQAEALAAMRAEVLAAAETAARGRGCSVRRERVWDIEPRPFDPWLVATAEEVCAELAPGAPRAMTSGALHDAGELAARVPVAMLFCASRGGLSHCADEDSEEAAIELGVRALDRLTRRALAR